MLKAKYFWPPKPKPHYLPLGKVPLLSISYFTHLTWEDKIIPKYKNNLGKGLGKPIHKYTFMQWNVPKFIYIMNYIDVHILILLEYVIVKTQYN